MFEDLVVQYGTLRPLRRDDVSELHRSLSAFEDSSELVLAPYLLGRAFLDALEEKTRTSGEDDEQPHWQTLWAVVHDGETVVGFLDFAGRPDHRGAVEMRYFFNEEWINSPLAMESIQTISDYAFETEECRSVRIGGRSEEGLDVGTTLRRLGFREEIGPDHREWWRLSKAVEGRLL